MIDIHSHILFGVDDGAKTINDSLELINEEIHKGISHVILTPHFNKEYGSSNLNKILENYYLLNTALNSRKLNIELFLGSEIYLDMNYYDTIWNEQLITLAGSDYILIEFSVIDVLKNIPEICYEIGIKGYIPIIAHVERYEILYNNAHLINEILNEGAYFQVNASTIVNKDNKKSHKFINYLLKNQLVSFVASDIHNLSSRNVHLDEAYKIVKKTYGEIYANKIFKLNQKCVIINSKLERPKLVTEKQSIINKILKNNY